MRPVGAACEQGRAAGNFSMKPGWEGAEIGNGDRDVVVYGRAYEQGRQEGARFPAG